MTMQFGPRICVVLSIYVPAVPRYNCTSSIILFLRRIGVHETMDFPELISRLALALGIGLLFGLERGWRAREERPGGRAAGIRPFAISGVLAGMIGAIGHSLGSTGGGVAMGLGFAAYGATLAVFCLEENRAQQDLSATTWVAAMLTFE